MVKIANHCQLHRLLCWHFTRKTSLKSLTSLELMRLFLSGKYAEINDKKKSPLLGLMWLNRTSTYLSRSDRDCSWIIPRECIISCCTVPIRWHPLARWIYCRPPRRPTDELHLKDYKKKMCKYVFLIKRISYFFRVKRI